MADTAETAPTVEPEVAQKSWERRFEEAQSTQQDAALQRYAEAETPGQERRALRRAERVTQRTGDGPIKAPMYTAIGPQKPQTEAAGQVGLRFPTSETYSFQQYIKSLSPTTKKK